MAENSCVDLLKSRTIITLVFSGTYCVLCLTGKPIPQTLEKIVLGFILFWFGEKIIKYIKNGKENGEK
jgi:hypothetical protein